MDGWAKHTETQEMIFTYAAQLKSVKLRNVLILTQIMIFFQTLPSTLGALTLPNCNHFKLLNT